MCNNKHGMKRAGELQVPFKRSWGVTKKKHGFKEHNFKDDFCTCAVRVTVKIDLIPHKCRKMTVVQVM